MGRCVGITSGEGEPSLLTDRQIEVLRLREGGRSQQEIADILGTTRSNVSIIESRALQNVKKAKRTLEEWMTIRAPVVVTVPRGSDIFQVPEMIFQEADRLGLRLPIDAVEIIVQLRSDASSRLRGRMVLVDLAIYVTREGEMLIKHIPKGDGPARQGVAGKISTSGQDDSNGSIYE